MNEELLLLFVDFEAQVFGIEGAGRSRMFLLFDDEPSRSPLGWFSPFFKKESGFRGVGNLNAHSWKKGKKEEYLRPNYGDCDSVTGPLAFLKGLFKKNINRSDVGAVLEFGEYKWTVRPCRECAMSEHLYRRHVAWMQRYRYGCRHVNSACSNSLNRFHRFRRLCFENRFTKRPKTVEFAKSTTVAVPAGAIARIGDSDSPTVVFLDRFARPISAFKSIPDGRRCYPESIPVPKDADIDWGRFGIIKELVIKWKIVS